MILTDKNNTIYQTEDYKLNLQVKIIQSNPESEDNELLKTRYNHTAYTRLIS